MTKNNTSLYWTFGLSVVSTLLMIFASKENEGEFFIVACIFNAASFVIAHINTNKDA